MVTGNGRPVPAAEDTRGPEARAAGGTTPVTICSAMTASQTTTPTPRAQDTRKPATIYRPLRDAVQRLCSMGKYHANMCPRTDLHAIHPPLASRTRLKREAFCCPLCPFGNPSGTSCWDRSGCRVNCENVERSGSGTGVAGCPDLSHGWLQKRVSGASLGQVGMSPMCLREGGPHLVDEYLRRIAAPMRTSPVI